MIVPTRRAERAKHLIFAAAASKWSRPTSTTTPRCARLLAGARRRHQPGRHAAFAPRHAVRPRLQARPRRAAAPHRRRLRRRRRAALPAHERPGRRPPTARRCTSAPRPTAKSPRAPSQRVAATIFRPSVVFGPGDNFLNMFARMQQLAAGGAAGLRRRRLPAGVCGRRGAGLRARAGATRRPATRCTSWAARRSTRWPNWCAWPAATPATRARCSSCRDGAGAPAGAVLRTAAGHAADHPRQSRLDEGR